MVFAVETYCPATDGFSAARIEEEVILTPQGAEDHLAVSGGRAADRESVLTHMTNEANSKARIGWIGTGRMGYEMAARLAKGGADVTVGTARARRRSRSRSTARRSRTAWPSSQSATSCSCMVVDLRRRARSDPRRRTGCFPAARSRRSSSSARRSRSKARPTFAKCSTARGIDYLAAPVSGNAKVIKAGRLSFVVLGAARDVRHRVAVPEADRPGGELRRRRRARAHREDLPQRVPRRGHAVARGDHRARREGRRAARTRSSTS